jgi:hypothetical protein
MLPEIRIASPCTANWEKMTGDARARHCAECNLDVYNFSEMTSAEIEQLLTAGKGQRVCGRFYRRADGTILTSDCTVGFRARMRRVTRRIGVALSAALTVGIANAQTHEQSGAATHAERALSEIDISVVDLSGAAVPDAKVNVRNEFFRVAEGSTDSSGRFRLNNLPKGRYEVTVRFLGIESAVVQVQLPQSQPRSIVIKASLGGATVHPELATMGWVTSDSLEVPAEPAFVDQLLGKLFPAPAGSSSQPTLPTFKPPARK